MIKPPSSSRFPVLMVAGTAIPMRIDADVSYRKTLTPSIRRVQELKPRLSQIFSPLSPYLTAGWMDFRLIRFTTDISPLLLFLYLDSWSTVCISLTSVVALLVTTCMTMMQFFSR
ncbi:unnamed protein product [Cyclocybe aegerita]|uniref:Uncharacterized protein n=1 Tax=Cyclocybe aegerita TaxID=1973307 RepID=A0A8S0WS01_CYCAE|nr:unnamed protein product [Cyclocybe aegerita]